MGGRGTTAAARVASALLVLVLAACSGASGAGDQGAPAGPSKRPDPVPASPTPPAHPRVYVAVGASETVGVGADDPATQAWPRVLHDKWLPATRFVDVGVSGATVRDGLATQLPQALAAQPDVVTVWLAVNDVISLAPVEDYEA